jgi:hypothetical protein
MPLIFIKSVIRNVPNTFKNFNKTSIIFRSRDGVVGIATGYGLDGRVPVGSRIFSTSRQVFLSNGYRGLFPLGKAVEA